MSVRAAVVGVGRMGRRHLEALKQVGAEIVAIADPDDANRAQAAVVAPAARRFYQWRELLAHDCPDLLCVATTSPAHADVVIGAASARVPRVLCEKPLATSLQAGRAMALACRTSGTRLVINHSRRLFGPYRRIERALAADGPFGDVRFMRATCGASGLANIGTHVFDLMCWFCGPGRAVVGHLDPSPLSNARRNQFSDHAGHGEIEFGGGRRATFDFTSDFPAGLVVEFGCRYGRIAVYEQSRRIEAFARTTEGRTRPLGDYFAPVEAVALSFDEPVDIVQMTAVMIRHTLGDERPVCGAEDALAALEIAAATHISHREGHRRVELPLADDRGSLAAIA
jgi:predicted dehydrogenase